MNNDKLALRANEAATKLVDAFLANKLVDVRVEQNAGLRIVTQTGQYRVDAVSRARPGTWSVVSVAHPKVETKVYLPSTKTVDKDVIGQIAYLLNEERAVVKQLELQKTRKETYDTCKSMLDKTTTKVSVDEAYLGHGYGVGANVNFHVPSERAIEVALAIKAILSPSTPS